MLKYAFIIVGKDLIGLAQTGSGKTGAFALPILQALLDSPQAFFACVMSPTRLVMFCVFIVKEICLFLVTINYLLLFQGACNSDC